MLPQCSCIGSCITLLLVLHPLPWKVVCLLEMLHPVCLNEEEARAASRGCEMQGYVCCSVPICLALLQQPAFHDHAAAGAAEACRCQLPLCCTPC